MHTASLLNAEVREGTIALKTLRRGRKEGKGPEEEELKKEQKSSE